MQHYGATGIISRHACLPIAIIIIILLLMLPGSLHAQTGDTAVPTPALPAGDDFGRTDAGETGEGMSDDNVAEADLVVSQPDAVATQLSADDLLVTRYFDTLSQGAVGLLSLRGQATLQSATVAVSGHTYRFVRNGDSWVALLVVDIDMAAGEHRVTVLAIAEDGSYHQLDFVLTVTSSNFFTQMITLPASRADLASMEVERQEFEQIDRLTRTIDTPPFWQTSPFRKPITSSITSKFGVYRIMNGAFSTRHTGWDQGAAPGTPVAAMNAGTVVFADRMSIRGNYVLIDHGWGIYSGYAHFSQFSVVPGQTVMAGQVIGLSGNTGRSSGPHLHWEMIVNGQWVDGLQLIEQPLSALFQGDAGG